jgi:hypothetical protein
MDCVEHVDTIVKYHIRREFCFPFKEEFENIKGAIRFCISKKDLQEELEDTKGVIRSRTPKKVTQEEFEDTKGVMRGRTPKEGQTQRA